VKFYSLAIISIFLFTACNSDDINDKSKRNEYWDWWVDAKTGKGQWIPVSEHPTWKNGKYTNFYSTGIIYSKGTIRNGEQVDTVYFYNTKEDLFEYRVIKSDTAIDYYFNEGHVILYRQNGTLEGEGDIKNHTYTGRWIKYYENGNKKSVQNYINDTGWQVEYYQTGQVEDSSYHSKRGDSNYTFKSWYEDGQISVKRDLKEGIANGLTTHYYENGKIKWTGYYINGIQHGIQKEYYESGQLRTIATIKNGVANGQFITYYQNGKVEVIGYAVNNLPEGEMRKFDENGKVIQDKFFKKGVRIK
jgi:antitoxin component YwqK of YwqJK toxin-antitoxin module